MTSSILRDLGYHVTTQAKSLEAVDLIVSKPESFDLVITDQTMPQLTGDHLASKILHLFQHIPVILCTGYSSRFDSGKAAATGVSAFIMKPIDRKTFATTIRQVLDNNHGEGI